MIYLLYISYSSVCYTFPLYLGTTIGTTQTFQGSKVVIYFICRTVSIVELVLRILVRPALGVCTASPNPQFSADLQWNTLRDNLDSAEEHFKRASIHGSSSSIHVPASIDYSHCISISIGEPLLHLVHTSSSRLFIDPDNSVGPCTEHHQLSFPFPTHTSRHTSIPKTSRSNRGNRLFPPVERLKGL